MTPEMQKKRDEFAKGYRYAHYRIAPAEAEVAYIKGFNACFEIMQEDIQNKELSITALAEKLAIATSTLSEIRGPLIGLDAKKRSDFRRDKAKEALAQLGEVSPKEEKGARVSKPDNTPKYPPRVEVVTFNNGCFEGQLLSNRNNGKALPPAEEYLSLSEHEAILAEYALKHQAETIQLLDSKDGLHELFRHNAREVDLEFSRLRSELKVYKDIDAKYQARMKSAIEALEKAQDAYCGCSFSTDATRGYPKEDCDAHVFIQEALATLKEKE